MKKWVIYKITSPSGRVYIGVTSNFNKRMSHYKRHNIKGQPKLFSSFSKYGFINHKVHIVEEFESDMDYALGREMFWIRSYMSNAIKWKDGEGLNLTDGGQGTIGWRASDEHKKKLSEIHKANPSRGMLGKKLTDDQKIHLSLLNTKNPSRGMWGKKLTPEQRARLSEIHKNRFSHLPIKIKPTKEETRLKMSLAKKGKPTWNKGIKMTEEQTKNNKNKFQKGMVSWNKGRDYSNLSAEERQKRFGLHNVGHTRNRGRKYSKEHCEMMSLHRIGKPNVSLYKPILQYDLNGEFIKEYDSIKNASNETGLSGWTIGNIAKALNKRQPPFIFKYK